MTTLWLKGSVKRREAWARFGVIGRAVSDRTCCCARSTQLPGRVPPRYISACIYQETDTAQRTFWSLKFVRSSHIFNTQSCCISKALPRPLRALPSTFHCSSGSYHFSLLNPLAPDLLHGVVLQLLHFLGLLFSEPNYFSRVADEAKKRSPTSGNWAAIIL